MNVSVYAGIRLLISDTENGACRISPDSGQLDQIGVIFRYLSSLSFNNQPTSFMQIPGPGIITQSFPAFQHLVASGLRQGMQGWKTAHKPFIIRNHCFDSCLL